MEGGSEASVSMGLLRVRKESYNSSLILRVCAALILYLIRCQVMYMNVHQMHILRSAGDKTISDLVIPLIFIHTNTVELLRA